MWIKFNLDGMDFNLKIENYEPNQTFDGKWVQVSFDFEFKDIIKYKKEKTEILLCAEIDEIRKYLYDLLNDKFIYKEHYECIEPDFEFFFYPKYDIKNNKNLIFIKSSSTSVVDIGFELKVNLWNECLSCNNFSTFWERNDIEKLYLYLSLITKKILISDERIIKLIDSKVIYNKGIDRKLKLN